MGSALAVSQDDTDTDAALEQRITTAKLRSLMAKTPASRRLEWDRLKALIAQRSDAQVARMEAERGLVL